MIVLAYDLGGTKIAAAAVDARGRVLLELREPAVFDHGRAAVIEQMARMGKKLLALYPSIRRGAIASAGPLNPRTGELLDPTNFTRNGKRWGRTPLASLLSRKLRIPLSLENDAAAAILAEHWIGGAKGYANALVLTLGTGLGTGMWANGELVRAGRELHPEAGHLILRAGDRSARCGCGNLGCAEAFLSGNGFARRASSALREPGLTGAELAKRAKRGNLAAKRRFEEYSELLATAIHNLCVIYAPEVVVLTGSFAEAASLFVPSARRHLRELLARKREGVDLLPRIVPSPLKNQASLIGAAYIATQPSRKRPSSAETKKKAR